MKGAVLFVDDERNLLQGLRRSLHRKRGDWKMHFACGVSEAIAIADENELDVIVSDMRMPEMDGAAFLAQIAKSQPSTARFILSGQSEQESIFRAIGVSHQFFSKPCDIEMLVGTIDRILQYRSCLDADSIRMLSSLPALPSSGAAAVMVGDALESGADDALLAAICQDPGMSIKVLQLTNSTYFGHAVDVVSAANAASMLGMSIAKDLWEAGLLMPQTSEEGRINENVTAPEELSDAIGRMVQHCEVAGISSAETALCKTAMLLQSGFRSLQGSLPIARTPTGERVGLSFLLALWGLPDQLIAIFDETTEADCDLSGVRDLLDRFGGDDVADNLPIASSF